MVSVQRLEIQHPSLACCPHPNPLPKGEGTFWIVSKYKCIGIGVLACGLLLGVGIRFVHIDWTLEPMRSNSIALARIGRMPDVRGVAVYGIPEECCGNYFYLRRNVPYLAKDEHNEDAIVGDARWKEGRINYLLTRPGNVFLFYRSQPEEVDRVGQWGIYRLKKPGQVTRHVYNFNKIPSKLRANR